MSNCFLIHIFHIKSCENSRGVLYFCMSLWYVANRRQLDSQICFFNMLQYIVSVEVYEENTA